MCYKINVVKRIAKSGDDFTHFDLSLDSKFIYFELYIRHFFLLRYMRQNNEIFTQKVMICVCVFACDTSAH